MPHADTIEKIWITPINLQRINALKAEMNVSLKKGEKKFIQNDVVDHLFQIYREYLKMKRELYELKKKGDFSQGD